MGRSSRVGLRRKEKNNEQVDNHEVMDGRKEQRA
jgi:hypothetical protein